MRRVFRFLFSNYYRKFVWNPLINSWAKDRGFDRRKYVVQNNIHAILSAMLLFQVVYWLYYSEYLRAVGIGIVEVIVDLPAIVLSKYLYLITIRRSNQALHTDSEKAAAFPDR